MSQWKAGQRCRSSANPPPLPAALKGWQGQLPVQTGRSSGHPARLNLGDCFAYALAKDVGEPLLYKGDDFVYTDVRSVFPRGHVEGVSPQG